MSGVENQLIEQLKDVGNRLLEPPSSPSELLKLLDDVELLLSKFEQSPSQPVRDALFKPMKSLIADDLLRNSNDDVQVTLASCLNEILRVSAPTAPYEGGIMKEVFGLIVSSFDKLSLQSGRCFSKAVLNLENVARLQSCVMMLDLDCDELVVKMFELFLKNIRSDHPKSVFLNMKAIMTLVIKESDVLSLEVLKVLLASIRKENQLTSHTPWKLGAEVIEDCAEKLQPYIIKIVKSLCLCLEDYAPILPSIYGGETDIVNNHVDDSANHVVDNEPPAHKSQVIELVQCLKAVERCPQNAAGKTDSKTLADPGIESGSAGSKKGKKVNSHSPDEGLDNLSLKEKTSIESSHGRQKKSYLASNCEERAISALEDMASKGKTKEGFDREQKQLHLASALGLNSKKKGMLTKKKDVSGGSGSKSVTGPSRKDKSHINDASKSQRKRLSLDDDDVIETPHGRKHYKEDLIGCRIKVLWPLDDSSYEGTITSYDASTKKHKVDYDDGDEEVLNLRNEVWEFLGEETFDMDLFDVKKTPQRRPDVSLREGSAEGEKEASQDHTDKKGAVTDSGVDPVERNR